MRPGITCLWQISGRNRIGFDEWMKLDLEYIDNWSLWLDIKIFWITFVKVFRRVDISQVGQATMEVFKGSNN